MPRDQFVAKSVADAGPDWIARFDSARLHPPLADPRRLGRSPCLAPSQEDDYTIWDRNNLWMLNNAMVNGGENVTVIALWDGNPGDGPGGTEPMVRRATERGARVLVIDAKTL